MTHWEKYLLWKHKELSLDPQQLLKRLGVVVYTCNLNTEDVGRVETEETGLLAGSSIEKDNQAMTSAPFPPTHAYTYTFGIN